MQKNRLDLREIFTSRIKDCLPTFSFFLIAGILFAVNAFPSLYGDEFGSLGEARHLTGYIHPIGYYFQLYIWSSINQSDWFLRLLSVVWLGAGIYFLDQWLKFEEIPSQVGNLTIWLALLNPFLWFYGFQIRFYAMFFASSILFIWRFRAWQKQASGRYLFYLLLSALLLLTSNLFGTLVVGTVLLNYIWVKLGSKRWILAFVLAFAALVIYLPFTRSALLWVLARASKSTYVPTAEITRGISLAILAKVPFTFFVFTVGLRVHPLWGWFTVPAMLLMVSSLMSGLWYLRRLLVLNSLTIFMLLNILFMFLILDPLAPPQVLGAGAAPRYLVFVVPYFLLLLALGAQTWHPLKYALIVASLGGIYFLAFPTWSYGGDDFVNWKKMLAQAVASPQDTCIITDGRANGAVERYHPANIKIAYQGNLTDCTGFKRIVLVSNDYRLSMVRYFDETSVELSNKYNLVSNTTLFPAQVTVYEQNIDESSQLPPSRLDLPEQDLRFPLTSPNFDRKIQGFVRLDAERSNITIPLTQENLSDLWILTNYRSDLPVVDGTPVFRLQFSDSNGNDHEIILRAGVETAVWNGSCNSCKSVYQWTKLAHLLGSYSYPGAYRQYKSHIWGFLLTNLIHSKEFNSVNVAYLLPDGTGYFYGIFP